MLNRREFLKKSVVISAGSLFLSGITGNSLTPTATADDEDEPLRISQVDDPLAIAMWDYSWILRHHRYGEFHDWDRALNGLAERGYNAIRIDVMPQFVAADSSGTVQKEFRSVKTSWKPSLWGNDYTMSFRPREALLEFLPRCREHGIRVGISTWFHGHGTEREHIFTEENGLERAWLETLSFLREHGLLENVIYVDVLNEYPNWHGYTWLKEQLKKRANSDRSGEDQPGALQPNVGENTYNDRQQAFYNRYINQLLGTLKREHPDMDFFTSLDAYTNLDRVNLSRFDALDYHLWFAHPKDIPGLDKIKTREPDTDFHQANAEVLDYWNENRDALVQWMEKKISSVSRTAEQHKIPCGITEGWGPIFWFDHPELSWSWTKTAGEIGVDLATKHDQYKFICTSNFTHPQFQGMWNDKPWHQKMTSRIKKDGG